MMRTRSLLAALACLAAASAQAAGPDGKWMVKWIGGNGIAGEARVQVAGETGTFKRYLVGRNMDACLALEAPLRVKPGVDGKLVLLADYASVLPDCRNMTLNLQPVDDRTMKGTLNRTLDVVLTRE